LEGKAGSCDKSSGLYTVVTDIGELQVAPGGISLEIGEEIQLVVRQESIDLAVTENGLDGNKFRGTIETSMFVGSQVEYKVRVENTTLTVFLPKPRNIAILNGEVTVGIPRDLHILKR